MRKCVSYLLLTPPPPDVPAGEAAYYMLVTSGMEATAIALEQAMVHQTMSTKEHTFVLYDVLRRIAALTQFDNLRHGRDINGAPLPLHGNTDYAFRVDAFADYIRLYANQCWALGDDSTCNISESDGIQEISLSLVTNDTHEVIVEPTKTASLKRYEGAGRESMVRLYAYLFFYYRF